MSTIDAKTSAKPKILFLTIAAGGSHVSSAQAMREAIEAYYPGDYRLELLEPMLAYGFDELDKRHKVGWRRALARPWTVVWGQQLLDRFPRLTLAFHRRLLRDFAARASEMLRRDPPALIVVNHGWLTVALTMSQQRFGLDVPVLTFETSTINANALWADPDAERFIVGSGISRQRLLDFGIDAAKVDVVGYPVKQAFIKALSKSAARNALGLDSEFTCLVSLGGEGLGGKPLELVRMLTGLGVQVVVISGRNEDLKAELEHLSLPKLRVEGFVDNMATFVAASDLVIGRTGPASVYETLAVGRPLVATMTSGTIENKMIRFLEAGGLGHYAPDAAALRQIISRYQQEPERLEEVATRCQRLDFAGMGRRLADYLTHYADTRQAASAALGPGIPANYERDA